MNLQAAEAVIMKQSEASTSPRDIVSMAFHADFALQPHFSQGLAVRVALFQWAATFRH